MKIYTNLFEVLSNKSKLPSRFKIFLNDDKKQDPPKSLNKKYILDKDQISKNDQFKMQESRPKNKITSKMNQNDALNLDAS
jgi:hypothetical protein